VSSWTCESCETRPADKQYIDRTDGEEKYICSFCSIGRELQFVEVNEDHYETSDYMYELVRTEEKLCGIPDDAWDAIASVINGMERGIIGDYLRLRGFKEKATAVEGAHRGLLRHPARR
jgi:hypothetical protein